MGQPICPQCGSGANVRTVAELFTMLNGAQGGATQQPYPGQQTGPDQPGTYPGNPAQGYQAPGYQAPDSAGTSPDNPAQGYQAPDSAEPNPDHPYPSYQGPGFPTQGYQSPGSGPPPSYQGPGFPTGGYQDEGPPPGYRGPDYPNSQRRGPMMDMGFADDPAQEIANAVLGAAAKFAGGRFAKRMQKAFDERIAPAMEARMAQARQQWQPSRDDQAAIVQRYPDLCGCLRDQVVFLTGGSRTVPITDIRMPLTLAQADAVVDRLRAP